MTGRVGLAVVLRQTQWELDHVAFGLPRGEITEEERTRLVHSLRELAYVLEALTLPSEEEPAGSGPMSEH